MQVIARKAIESLVKSKYRIDLIGLNNNKISKKKFQ